MDGSRAPNAASGARALTAIVLRHGLCHTVSHEANYGA
jgi:hypothetical protein